jgi:hypothetical protein
MVHRVIKEHAYVVSAKEFAKSWKAEKGKLVVTYRKFSGGKPSELIVRDFASVKKK